MAKYESLLDGPPRKEWILTPNERNWEACLGRSEKLCDHGRYVLSRDEYQWWTAQEVGQKSFARFVTLEEAKAACIGHAVAKYGVGDFQVIRGMHSITWG